MLPGVRTPKESWHSFPASVINYMPRGSPLPSLAISTCLKGPDPAAQNRWHKVWKDSVADSSASACPGSSMHLGASSLPGLNSLNLAPRQPLHRPFSCARSFLTSRVSGCYLPGCWGWPPLILSTSLDGLHGFSDLRYQETFPIGGTLSPKHHGPLNPLCSSSLHYDELT